MSPLRVLWRRVCGRTLVATAVTVAALLCIWGSMALRQLDDQLIEGSGPHEGYYWTVAQYELAFLRAREAEVILTLGGDPGDEKLAQRVAVLMSKSLILTNESELTSFFRQIPGYLSSVEKISAFHRRADPLLDSPAWIREHAGELMNEFNALEVTILALANEVRLEEMQSRHQTIETLRKRRQLIWLGLWASFAMLLLWVLSISIYWSRYMKEARARELALESERRAVQANTRFLGMVGHELRSPLQSIVSALDIFESKHASWDQAQLTRQIRRAANELNVQLRDLLTLARGRTGRIELRPEVFEACELVRESVQAWHKVAQDKGLRLSIDTPAEPVFVVADGGRIAQVLNNLVGNAVRYTESGTVEVSMHSPETENPQLRIRIADSGPPLPQEALVTLIDGLDATPVTSARRRGLGLALVNVLLRQLNGKVRLQAIEPTGKAIELEIPVVRAKERPATRVDGQGRILIIEDGSGRVTNVVPVCTSLALECDTAHSAAMALNYLAAHAYEIILVDLGMPGRTGTELIGEAKASDLNAGARLIALMSGPVRNQDDLRLFDAVLTKPLTREKFGAAMRAQTTSSAPPR